MGIRQSDLEPDQSKGPLQSDAVVITANHLKLRPKEAFISRYTPTDMPYAPTLISLPIASI